MNGNVIFFKGIVPNLISNPDDLLQMNQTKTLRFTFGLYYVTLPVQLNSGAYVVMARAYNFKSISRMIVK